MKEGTTIQQAQVEVADGTRGVMKEGTTIQQAQAKVVDGFGGVMKKKDVEVVVISQQVETNVEDAVVLVPNGNMEEQMQLNVEVGETFATTYVTRIEIELHITINMIEEQEIVALGQENANGDVELHVQIDAGGDILNLIYYN
jgi:hypothetical protein